MDSISPIATENSNPYVTVPLATCSVTNEQLNFILLTAANVLSQRNKLFKELLRLAFASFLTEHKPVSSW